MDLIENAERFIERYCTSSEDNQNAQEQSNNEEDNNLDYLDMPITMEEFEAAIKISKKTSSPGLDQVEYQMLQFLPKPTKEILLSTINQFLENNIFPEEWHEYLVILIPKKSKAKFRPIALASCVLKIVERILNTRLQQYIESEKLIPNSQYGFRKKRSCISVITILITKILSTFNDGESLCGVMLDIESAFDNVSPKTLQLILNKLKIPKKIKQFINNLMTMRKLYFKVANNLQGP